MLTMLCSLFTTIFRRSDILALARQVGAVERLREVHPGDLVRALVESALGDETRTISSARRRYGRISGFHVEESAFYGRFNAGLVLVLRELLKKAMERCSGSTKTLLASLLDRAGVADMLALDASRFTLPSWTKEAFPSTEKHLGGAKLTAFMSVLRPMITKFILTDARQHDRKAVRLPRWLHGILILMDRGYCDRKLFAQIEDRKGFFLTRLKKNFKPVITAIRSGLAASCLGQRLTGDLPMADIADFDVLFPMPGGGYRQFRVVRFVVGSQRKNSTDQPVALVFVTNLSPSQFTVEQLATLYRFRWEIERLFLVTKQVGRLDHLRSGNRHVVEAFVLASLLAVTLGLAVCNRMRDQHTHSDPSLWRVTALVLEYLPNIAAAVGSSLIWTVLLEFDQALWREGVNPNPGRPSTARQYTFELGWQEACRPSAEQAEIAC